MLNYFRRAPRKPPTCAQHEAELAVLLERVKELEAALKTAREEIARLKDKARTLGAMGYSK